MGRVHMFLRAFEGLQEQYLEGEFDLVRFLVMIAKLIMNIASRERVLSSPEGRRSMQALEHQLNPLHHTITVGVNHAVMCVQEALRDVHSNPMTKIATILHVVHYFWHKWGVPVFEADPGYGIVLNTEEETRQERFIRRAMLQVPAAPPAPPADAAADANTRPGSAAGVDADAAGKGKGKGKGTIYEAFLTDVARIGGAGAVAAVAQHVTAADIGVPEGKGKGKTGKMVNAPLERTQQQFEVEEWMIEWADEARRWAADGTLDQKMSSLLYIYTVMPKIEIGASPIKATHVDTFETMLEGQDAKACLIYILNFIKKALNGPMTPRAKLIMLSIACEWITARLALPRPESYGGLIVQLSELIGQPVSMSSSLDGSA